MNMLFGVASTAGKAMRFDMMHRHIENLFQSKVQTIEDLTGSVRCGYIADNGSILGKATIEGHFLAYLGFLQKPLPEWNKVCPLDKPDQTALYLLTRFFERGPRFLDNIFGQYVVILCDINRSTLILGSDPNGFRRVFYCRNDDELVFGTNLVSIAGAFENGLEIDRSLENFLLGYEFLPWNRTPLKGTAYLPPGTLLEFSNGAIQRQTINSNNLENTLQPIASEILDEKEAIRRLHDTFMLTLEEQCPSTDQIGVLLGGFDSALVAAGLKQLGKEIETFSFYFDDSEFNQAYTEELASFLGIRHTWVPITPEVIREGLQNYSLRFNQIYSQPHYLIQTAYTCSVMRERGYLHCFTGDGCDDLFLGYPSVYKRAKLFLKLNGVPRSATNLLLYLLRWSFLEKHFGHTYRMARNVVSILGQSMPVRGHITNRIFDELSLKRLRMGIYIKQEKDVEEILVELALGLENLSPLRLAFHGKAAAGVNRNRNEGSSALTGLTIQSPYTHPTLLRLGVSIPENLLRPQEKNKDSGSGKYILMNMAKENKLLPEEIIYQKKASPVAAPIDRWYMGALREFLLTSLSTLPFNYNQQYISNLVRPKFAEELFRKHVSIGHYASNAISLLATYANLSKFASKINPNR
ncbi:asparagine synthase-related protein [Thermodesulfobacteriota bacterium]